MSAASTSRAKSAGESQVERARAVWGRSSNVMILADTIRIPKRSA